MKNSKNIKMINSEKEEIFNIVEKILRTFSKFKKENAEGFKLYQNNQLCNFEELLSIQWKKKNVFFVLILLWKFPCYPYSPNLSSFKLKGLTLKENEKIYEKLQKLNRKYRENTLYKKEEEKYQIIIDYYKLTADFGISEDLLIKDAFLFFVKIKELKKFKKLKNFIDWEYENIFLPKNLCNDLFSNIEKVKILSIWYKRIEIFWKMPKLYKRLATLLKILSKKDIIVLYERTEKKEIWRNYNLKKNLSNNESNQIIWKNYWAIWYLNSDFELNNKINLKIQKKREKIDKYLKKNMFCFQIWKIWRRMKLYLMFFLEKWKNFLQLYISNILTIIITIIISLFFSIFLKIT